MTKRRRIMGFWSISLYGNDLTLDVRDKLDDLLKSGVSQKEFSRIRNSIKIHSYKENKR